MFVCFSVAGGYKWIQKYDTKKEGIIDDSSFTTNTINTDTIRKPGDGDGDVLCCGDGDVLCCGVVDVFQN